MKLQPFRNRNRNQDSEIPGVNCRLPPEDLPDCENDYDLDSFEIDFAVSEIPGVTCKALPPIEELPICDEELDEKPASRFDIRGGGFEQIPGVTCRYPVYRGFFVSFF